MKHTARLPLAAVLFLCACQADGENVPSVTNPSAAALPGPEQVRVTTQALAQDLGLQFATTPAIVPGATETVGGQAVGTGANYVLTAAFNVDESGALLNADCYTSGRPASVVVARFLTTCASVLNESQAADWVKAALQDGEFGSKTFGGAALQLGESNRFNARLTIKPA